MTQNPASPGSVAGNRLAHLTRAAPPAEKTSPPSRRGGKRKGTGKRLPEKDPCGSEGEDRKNAKGNGYFQKEKGATNQREGMGGRSGGP